MGKLRNDQKGFSVVEVILVLVIVILIGAVGWLVYKNHQKNTSTSTSSKTSTNTTQTSTIHTTEEATTFVQTTYDKYLSAVSNVASDNDQPLGLVGLAAVKDSLSSDFYTQAAASPNGSDFSCAGQFLPAKYTAGSASSTDTGATIPLTISNSSDGSTISGMTVNVDLATLKITAVGCPS